MATELKIAAEAQYNDNDAFKRADKDVDGLSKSIDSFALESEIAQQRSQQLKTKTNQLAQEVEQGKRSFRDAEKELADYRQGLDKASQETGKLKSSTSGIKANYKNLAVGIGGATVALAAVTEGAKVAYAALKEGAALNTASNQFDILSEKIGTTADVLLSKMQTATKGFVTDAELIRSANEIISLGLAKNEDDVVKLSTVISGLGLDMQQVILTFANNSVARLDALGLSVEDVKNKSEELQNQGFQGDAFDAAVLELLTQRYEEMAGAIDNVTTITTQAETSLSNFVSQFKSDFATGVGNILTSQQNAEKGVQALEQALEKGLITNFEYNRGWLALQTSWDGTSKESDKAIKALEELDHRATSSAESADKLLEKWAKVPEPLRNVYDGLTDTGERLEYLYKVSQDAGQVTDDLVITVDDVKAAEEKRQKALDESAKAQEELNQKMKESIARQGDFFISAAESEDALIKFARTATYAGGRTSEQNESLSELQDQYDKTADKIRSLESGTAGLGLSSEQLNEKLAKERETLAQLQGAIEPLANIQAELVSSNEGFVVNQELVNSKLISYADSAGASASALAVLKVATGELSEEQSIAALKSAALEEKLVQLGQSIADGLDPQVALANLKTFQQELENTEFTVPIRTEIDSESSINIGTIGGFSDEEIDVQIPLDANTEKAQETYDGWEATLTETAVAVPLDADTTLVDATYQTLKGQLEQPITIPVNISVSGGGVIDELRAIGGI